MCGPLSKILTILTDQTRQFPLPYLRPDQKHTGTLFRTIAVGTKHYLLRAFVDGRIDNDEKVASSQKHTQFKTTIPDKSVGTRSKVSPPPTFNVDNPVIFFPFCSKKRDFSNID